VHTQDEPDNSGLIEGIDAANRRICLAQRERSRSSHTVTGLARLWGPGHGPLAGDALRDLRLEGPPVDRRGPRPGGPPPAVRGVLLGGAGHRQGGRAHPVRHPKDRGQADPLGPGGCPGGASGGRATWSIGPWRRPERQSTPRPCPGGTSRRTPGSGCPRSSPRPQGAVVARALERLAETLPVMPGEEEDSYYVQARRADALVALCSARMAQDTRPRPGHGGHPRPAGRARLRGGWVCHRGRPGHPPRDRPAAAVSRAGADGDRGLYRPAGGPGPDVQGFLGSHAPPAPVPRRRVHLPRVRGSPVHPGPSHRVVGAGRPDRSGQPDPGVLLPL